METINNYNLYQKMVVQDFHRVKSFFPLLTLSILPLDLPSEITFNGYILPPEMNIIVCPAVIEKYGFKIRGVYPFVFPDKSVKVYDVDDKICWDKIPSEHRHFFSDDRSICTHHPDGEINAKPEQDRTIAVLFSAWQLFYQSKLYIEQGKKWALKDLPHGDQAKKILKKEGWIKIEP